MARLARSPRSRLIHRTSPERNRLRKMILSCEYIGRPCLRYMAPAIDSNISKQQVQWQRAEPHRWANNFLSPTPPSLEQMSISLPPGSGLCNHHRRVRAFHHSSRRNIKNDFAQSPADLTNNGYCPVDGMIEARGIKIKLTRMRYSHTYVSHTCGYTLYRPRYGECSYRVFRKEN